MGRLPVATLQRLVVAARSDEPCRALVTTPGLAGAVTGKGTAVVGAAGGSGETYLAAALTLAGCPSWAAGHRRPTGPGAVIVTVRSTAAHLAAAQRLLHRWKDDPPIAGQSLLGVAVLADAPMRPGRDIAATIDAIGAVVPAIWHISYQAAWRERLPSDLNVDKAVLAQLSPIAAAIAAASDEKENEQS